MTGTRLVIDAATARGTVAVVNAGLVLASADALMRGADEERLMPAVAATLAAASVTLASLSAVVCGAGPGSFTSLRIAAAIAKGLAAAAGVPLFQVSSLVLVVAGAEPRAAPGRYLVVLDAMRGDAFALRVNVAQSGSINAEGATELIGAGTAARLGTDEARTLVGPHTAPAWWPHARGVARLTPGPGGPEPADLDTWEPSYGRLAEAQVKWEKQHGRSLSA